MKKIICPTCRQDMRDEPHPGLKGKDCPQCGQGISWRKVKKKRRGEMDVSDIVKRFLEENGFDGLYTDECGCFNIDDLFPCGSECIPDCVPGYKMPGDSFINDEQVFIIGPKK